MLVVPVQSPLTSSTKGRPLLSSNDEFSLLPITKSTQVAIDYSVYMPFVNVGIFHY